MRPKEVVKLRLNKNKAFFIDLDSFLQQKEFIEVRLVYGFRQDCRKTVFILLNSVFQIKN